MGSHYTSNMNCEKKHKNLLRIAQRILPHLCGSLGVGHEVGDTGQTLVSKIFPALVFHRCLKFSDFHFLGS